MGKRGVIIRKEPGSEEKWRGEITRKKQGDKYTNEEIMKMRRKQKRKNDS